MRGIRIWIGLIVLLGSTSLKAQLTDSIKASLQHKPKLTAFFDTRNSFISNRHVKIRGVKAGLNFNRTTLFAVGYNWLDGDIPLDVLEDTTTYQANLKMWYISGMFQYTFYNTRYWEANIPIQLGAGPASYTYENSGGDLIEVDKSLVVFYETNMTLIYKPIKYIGLGGGIGYRLALWKPKIIDARLTAPLYTLKFNVYLGEIIQDVFGKEKIE